MSLGARGGGDVLEQAARVRERGGAGAGGLLLAALQLGQEVGDLGERGGELTVHLLGVGLGRGDAAAQALDLRGHGVDLDQLGAGLALARELGGPRSVRGGLGAQRSEVGAGDDERALGLGEGVFELHAARLGGAGVGVGAALGAAGLLELVFAAEAVFLQLGDPLALAGEQAQRLGHGGALALDLPARLGQLFLEPGQVAAAGVVLGVGGGALAPRSIGEGLGELRGVGLAQRLHRALVGGAGLEEVGARFADGLLGGPRAEVEAGGGAAASARRARSAASSRRASSPATISSASLLRASASSASSALRLSWALRISTQACSSLAEMSRSRVDVSRCSPAVPSSSAMRARSASRSCCSRSRRARSAAVSSRSFASRWSWSSAARRCVAASRRECVRSMWSRSFCASVAWSRS